jgi:predicted O-linked N-acetylglucosamine transferase (SPINDLY family)
MTDRFLSLEAWTSLVAPAGTSPELLARLAEAGIPESRVTLAGGTPHHEHLAAHSEIDIMLDTFPQSGGVTTLDSLVMGVPVVTLIGARVPGRISKLTLRSSWVGLAGFAGTTGL